MPRIVILALIDLEELEGIMPRDARYKDKAWSSNFVRVLLLTRDLEMS